ncbi:hypothetical protein [Haloechinothrix halophila]|uniref:hypothetical protein n=1 Tax=Haloechinothrix halophila TaxID=1069073 RepID=UPI000401A38C|nr:hypothetical protein [Haloechinothrix halophila]
MTTTEPTADPTVSPPTGARRDTSLVGRAVRAAHIARHVDPEFDTRAADHRRTAHRRALAHDFADAHGLDAIDVIVTDDPDRCYGTWRGFLITITDNGQYFTFLPLPGTDGYYLILGPCPGCDRPVPLADASDPPALGRYLDAIADDTEPPHPAEFNHDPAHAARCPATRHRRGHTA